MAEDHAPRAEKVAISAGHWNCHGVIWKLISSPGDRKDGCLLALLEFLHAFLLRFSASVNQSVAWGLTC